MIQEIKFSTDANTELLKGVNIVADAVKTTFGPHGRNVIIESMLEDESPHITKDGVTVARSINLENKFQNIGAKLIKDVALKTCDDVGDGTTTSTILTQYIINEGLKLANFGANTNYLKKGIDIAVKKVVEALLDNSKKIKEKQDIFNIAMVSTNGDVELSNILSDVFFSIGEEGKLNIKQSETEHTYSEFNSGLQLESGFVTYDFCSTSDPMITLEDVAIINSTEKISSAEDILDTLNALARLGKSVLIIAPEYTTAFITTLVNNNRKGILKICAIRAPGINEGKISTILDTGFIVGNRTVITNAITVGYANKVVITDSTTTIFEPQGDEKLLEERVEFLTKSMNHQPEGFHKDKLRQRLAFITNKIATLYIGGQSVVEIKEKKDRVDDAIHSIKSAMKDGVTIGSGLSLLRASKVLDIITTESNDIKLGIELIKSACKEPIKLLLSNAGIDLSKITTLLEEKNSIGFNLITKEYEDFYESGIIDPVKVVCATLENSASVGGLLLTTNCVIINKDK